MRIPLARITLRIAAGGTVPAVCLGGSPGVPGAAALSTAVAAGGQLLQQSTLNLNQATAGGDTDVINANTAVGQGGALFSTGDVTGKFVSFRRNHATQGGAVYSAGSTGSALSAGSLRLTNSGFFSNKADGSAGEADGGGLFINSRASLQGLTIRNNQARYRGGGMYVDHFARFDSFTGEVIAGNAAGLRPGPGQPPNPGGGIYDIQFGLGQAEVGSNSTVSANFPDNCAPLKKVRGCTG